MRRTRRAAAPDVAPEETAELAASESAATGQTAPEISPDISNAAAADVDADTKPKRRRSPRTASAKPAADQPASPSETPSFEFDSGSAAPEAAPEPIAEAPRRGGRRRKATEPDAAAAVEVSSTAPGESAPPVLPVEEPAAPKRRGRRKETPAAPTPEVATTPDPEAVATPRKRPGGRRTRTEPESVAEPETPLAEAQASEAEEVPPARRRRRRRGEPVAPASDEANAEAAPATEGSSEQEAETAVGEEGERKGRRRRSRRRRSGEVELPVDLSEAGDAGLIVPEAVSVDEFAEEDEDDSLVLISPPPPRYEAPRLVPPAIAPADGAHLPRVHARVQPPTRGGGLAQIVVNDRSHAPFFFFVNAEAAEGGEVVESQIRLAASAGIHLYSGVMYLPLKNAYGDRSFGAVDSMIQQIVESDPDGYVLPRLQIAPTNYWARTHLDQMAQYADGSEGDVSLASTEFWADCVDALDALIAHLSDPATVGADRIIGFHIDRGEWFYDQAAGYDYSEPNKIAFQNWLRAKYQFPYALRAAWFNSAVTFDDAAIPPWPGTSPKGGETPLYSGAREGRWPDYALFASDLVAQAITGLAEAIKTLSEGRLLVGVSYGYTLEFSGRNDSGHLALAQVLESPAIDILAGPNSYTGRGAGSVGAFGAPIDSVGLHGKLWLVEDDTKTFLAAEETPDTYNPKIASGADTQAAHERHFGAAIAHRAGMTWMDLWGQGWLDSPDIWRELGRLRDQADRLEQISEAPSFSPDVVAFVDEASLAYFRSNPAGLGHALVGKSRDLLLRSGASVGFYLQSDVTSENLPDAKLYLFLNAARVTTAERKAIRERLQRPGKTLAWLYAAGMFDENGLTDQEIGDTVGMVLRVQPWNTRLGSKLTDAKSPITARLRSSKRVLGEDEVLNPSFTVIDPQAIILAEYASTGAPSLAVREHASGWKSVFIGDPHLTSDLLRGLYAYADVPVYETQDDIVYAGEGVLLVHAPYTGQRNLNLPRRATVYDITEDRILVCQAKSFRAFLRARTTRIFLWGEGDAVASATGLALPEPTADTQEGPGEIAVEANATVGPRPRTTSSVMNDILSQSEPELFGDSDVSTIDSESSDDDSDAIAAGLSHVTAADESGDESAPSSNGAEPATSARRSRWQRRRAAMRARREAERDARAVDGSPGPYADGVAPADNGPSDMSAQPTQSAGQESLPETEGSD